MKTFANAFDRFVVKIQARISTSRNSAKSLSENRPREGDSPIFLPGHRKIGTVPDGSRIGSKWSGVEAQRSVGEFRTREFIGRRLGLVFLSMRADGLAHRHS